VEPFFNVRVEEFDEQAYLQCAIMTIGELVFWYSAIIIVLLLLFVVLLIRRKAGGKPIFAQADWRFLLGSPKGEGLSGEFWLKVSLAAFIGLCLGVIVALFVLPYGVPQAIAALLLTVVMLVVLLPKLLE
jgi:hypothetical protein